MLQLSAGFLMTLAPCLLQEKSSPQLRSTQLALTNESKLGIPDACVGQTGTESADSMQQQGSKPDTAQARPVVVIEGKPSQDAQKIAGMRGLDIETRVQFSQAGFAPHRRTLSLGFPDRGRWLLTPEGDRVQPRTISYRFGEQAFDKAWDRDHSDALTGKQRERSVLHLELMRATLIWPDGLEWKKLDEERMRADSALGGHIEAYVDKNGTPHTLRIFDGQGFARESLQQLQWRVGPKQRSWPKSWKFYSDGKFVWDEEVLEVDPAAHYLSNFFKPADRRLGSDRKAFVERDVQRIMLPEAKIIRVPFEKALEWNEAVIVLDSRAAQLKARGLEVDSARALPLTEDGLAQSGWLIIKSGGETLGAEVVTRPPATGFALPLRSPAFSSTGLARLRGAALESGSKPADAYLSWHRIDDAPVWRIVLPVRTRNQ